MGADRMLSIKIQYNPFHNKRVKPNQQDFPKKTQTKCQQISQHHSKSLRKTAIDIDGLSKNSKFKTDHPQ
jgi:hypothetical protein